MRIEKLLPPAGEGKPWTAALEGGEILTVGEREVLNFRLCSGMELDEDTWQALKQSAGESAARSRAAAILSARMCSRQTLVEKLIGKGIEEQHAENAADWAVRIGLLNEEQYAHAVAAHYRDRGYGTYKIKDEFYRRRIAREYWEDALEETRDEDAAQENIHRFLESRLKDPEDRKQIKKVSDALVRRGFSWEEIARGIERFREEARYN